MEQTFEVIGSKGDIYQVSFQETEEGMRARCNCLAGKHGTLCKHVLGIIKEHKEIYALLEKHGQLAYYQEYMDKQQEIEKLKKQAASAKQAFTCILLG